MARLHVWRDRAKKLKQEVHALALAMKHPQTPWYAKVLAACVVAYALSPIDLIPDPIPVVGYLDDLLLVPLGLAAVRRLIPYGVLNECRAQAQLGVHGSAKIGRVGAVVIVALWIVAVTLLGCGVYSWWTHSSNGVEIN